MKKFIVVLSLMLSSAAWAEPKDPVVGQWDWVYPENPSVWGPQVFTFQEDGAVLENGKVTAHWKRVDHHARKYELEFVDRGTSAVQLAADGKSMKGETAGAVVAPVRHSAEAVAAPAPPPPPPVPAPAPAGSPLITVEAGPLWSNADADRKCPGICSRKGGTWNHQWWTTEQNRMSVCQCDMSVPPVAAPAPPPPPAPAPPPPAPTACAADADMESIKAAIQNESFSADQLNALKMAAPGRSFCIAQVADLVDLFTFSGDKLAVVKMLKGQIADKSNSFQLLEHFTASVDKTEIQKILK